MANVERGREKNWSREGCPAIKRTYWPGAKIGLYDLQQGCIKESKRVLRVRIYVYVQSCLVGRLRVGDPSLGTSPPEQAGIVVSLVCLHTSDLFIVTPVYARVGSMGPPPILVAFVASLGFSCLDALAAYLVNIVGMSAFHVMCFRNVSINSSPASLPSLCVHCQCSPASHL